ICCVLRSFTSRVRLTPSSPLFPYTTLFRSLTSKATATWVGSSSRSRLMSIDVNPYTALVCWPVVVEKFSTGRAKNARYAIEWPSMSRSLGRAGAVTGASLGAMTDTDGSAAGPAAATPGTAAAERCRDTSGTLLERMGIELTEIGAERTAGTMPVAGNTQPAGLLHGGASAVLAESLGSIAATLHAGPGRAAV